MSVLRYTTILLIIEVVAGSNLTHTQDETLTLETEPTLEELQKLNLMQKLDALVKRDAMERLQSIQEPEQENLVLANETRRLYTPEPSALEVYIPYMVYLMRSELDYRQYDNWLCGGAIVSVRAIITAAACVIDVRLLYVISGTNLNVNRSVAGHDLCVGPSRKKVVTVCVPRGYNFSLDAPAWADSDIAVAKVDTPFNFKIKYPHCPFAPKKVLVNFDLEMEKPGVFSWTFGWGSRKYFRQPFDTRDLNVQKLRYLSQRVLNITMCMWAVLLGCWKWIDFRRFNAMVNRSMVCSHAPHNLLYQGGYGKKWKRVFYIDLDHHWAKMAKQAYNVDYNYTYGVHSVCQNDHGGPLVTYVVKSPTVIGVTSLSRLDRGRCMSPSLYTSTAKHSLFLACVLNRELEWSNVPVRFRRQYNLEGPEDLAEFCSSPARKKQYPIIRKDVVWKKKPIEKGKVTDSTTTTVKPETISTPSSTASTTTKSRTTTIEKWSTAEGIITVRTTIV